ncbi:kynureninase [Pseudonocardia sp.]|uniref:kynureninase n=1 Tax=Pseudonocardia sp. TaxID=60912 RepID=UPI003D0ED2B7
MTGSWQRLAAELDAADPLAPLHARFVTAEGVVAYLDGNSLGRPLAAAAQRLQEFVHEDWGRGLIRGWTDGPDPWTTWPQRVGDRVAALALGAAPGQTVVADSTTVLLYKLARAAVAARPDRHEIVVETGEFPTDRYVAEGVAAETGRTLCWREPGAAGPAAGPDTALLLQSHVDYRSGAIADTAAVTAQAHAAGALVLWDLSHSAGVVPVALDSWGADLAVGCTYKFLCGGPGSPAFAYVRRDLQETLRQPVQGWMGRRDPFAMGPGYVPAPGIRSVVSGTPPILATVPLLAALDLLAEAGLDAVRAKSVALTSFAVELADALLPGVTVGSPRDPHARGGHVLLRHPDAKALVAALWERGVLPDFREPDGIRVGLAPLSTSFAEVHRGLSVLADLLG